MIADRRATTPSPGPFPSELWKGSLQSGIVFWRTDLFLLGAKGILFSSINQANLQ